MITLHLSIGIGRVEFSLHEFDLADGNSAARMLRRIADCMDVKSVDPRALQKRLLEVGSGKLQIEIDPDGDF